ncbi:AAA domain-containing protein, putative AbiEii toxin, Type IV TA system [Ferrimonas sediminum]|uniref:AAA domain-containing protein, putative AbiEii toxin, Type IV TA system n=1 Tax=Ferrimonas sediminum TaxID=718193 RepID=A0A1G8UWM8_9GAMM|nr:AAA family ATPase [Ferrimonas sediminum]SDJ58276.1 AAA domain-containing protein, putative AbiEii toxin, Type IV TA system [Ferrimonas sediminum]
MRITKLSLTNFRSFKETQTIELAPVTLLFGPNSVGKSTVLMALFYLQQILEKGQCNPQRIEALGNKFVGGFKHLVNGRDLRKNIVIKVEYEPDQFSLKGYLEHLDNYGTEHPLYIDTDIISKKTRSLEFEIGWSFTDNTALVTRVSYWVAGKYLGESCFDGSLHSTRLSKINYAHPALASINQPDADGQYRNTPDLMESSYLTPLQEALCELSWHAGNPVDIEIEGQHFIHPLFGSSSHKRKTGGLFALGRPLTTTASEGAENLEDAIIITEILSECFIRPLDELRQLLNNSLSIGPLRKIPDSTYQPNPYPAMHNWYTGEAAWDRLHNASIVEVDSINDWISVKSRLNLGYQVVYKIEQSEARYIKASTKTQTVEDMIALHDAVGSEVELTVSRENLDDNPDTEQKVISPEILEALRETPCFHSGLYVGQSIEKNKRPTLWDTQNNIEVTASDIGVGVSQLLPLVVATITANKGFISCEQPELHVHPRVQVAIGDLLTQANDKANLIIETHSEHIVLRLLRRIRETYEGTLPAGFQPVTTHNISIVYIQPGDNGANITHQKVTDDGDFECDWPQGFFEERDEELF